MFRCLVDAPLEVVLRFERAALRRNQPEHGDLALRQKPQRLKASGARAVVFEKIAVDIDGVENELRDRLVTAFRNPGAGKIAAAQMHADRHAFDAVPDRVVDELGVGLRQRLRILADVGDLPAQLGIAEISEVDLVELNITAAGAREIADFLAVETGKIVIERDDVGIGLRVDRRTPAAKMHDAGRRQGDFRHRPRDRSEKPEIIDENAAVRPRELAGDRKRRWAVQAIAFGGMEAHRKLRRDHPHVAEFQHEVAVPRLAIVFAVGGELEPHLFLEADHLADRSLLDALELVRLDFALLRPLTRCDERIGPNEAADMLGAKWWLAASHAHGGSLWPANDSTRAVRLM